MPRDLSRKAPWEAFPQIPWGSIGWRMGDGEDYWCDWMDWYLKLSRHSRNEYQSLHPEPSESSWQGFYVFCDQKKPPEK